MVSVAITCGDWMADGRLALASGTRMKVSEPIGDSSVWETFSKFYIGKMVSKIPVIAARSEPY